MFDMGFLELALIAGIALIVLGPERLPVAARTVGRYIGQVKRFVGNFQRQIEQETRLEELNRKIMDDTKGQSFRNNDGTVTTKEEGEAAQSAAVTRAKSNRSAEAERARNDQPAGTDAAEPPAHAPKEHSQPPASAPNQSATEKPSADVGKQPAKSGGTARDD